MQESWSYIKDSAEFLKKVKHLGRIPYEFILVIADVLALYPSIPHKADLETLRKRLNEREKSEIPTEDIVQMAEFLFKNNFFEFNGEIKRQKSGTVIGTKFAPPYLAFSWMKIYKLFYGFVILTMYFSYGLMEHRNWILSLMSLTNFILI